MPITLDDYPGLDFYEKGLDQKGDQIRGDASQWWVRALLPGQTAPAIRTITAKASASADAETITVSSDVAVKLYRGDVLNFSLLATPKVVVVAADTEIGTSNTPLPVLPLIASIANNDYARTYALLPAIGVTDGGTPNTSGNMAQGRTRAGSLFDLMEVVGRSYTIAVNGMLLRNDPVTAVLESLALGRRQLFWQSRWHPYVTTVDENGDPVTHGMGVAARQGIAFVQSFDPPVPANDMVKFTAQLSGNGIHNPYLLLDGLED